MRAPFTRAMLRWLMQSKRRRLSISSSKNSMRSASAALAGNTSTIAPRMAHWPRPSTMGHALVSAADERFHQPIRRNAAPF